MLQTQVDYWKLIETQRHNKEAEAIEWENAKASVATAQANLRNAETNAKNAETNYLNALTEQRNAETARMNAESNRISALASQTQASASVKQANAAARQAAVAQSKSYSEIYKNQSEASKNRVQSGLYSQQTATEAYNTRIAETDSTYRAGYHSSTIANNYMSGIGSILSGAGSLSRSGATWYQVRHIKY